MVRPSNIRANEQTAMNNHYQRTISGVSHNEIQKLATIEFDGFIEKLKSVGINVIVFEVNDEFDTPDSHFPNNWVSFHENGLVGLYPMFAENRRLERREDVLFLLEDNGFHIEHIMDYREAEDEDLFLESTGSLVLDRENRKAYCTLSERASEELVIEFCEDFDYLPVIFTANQTVNGERKPIYHTNVMMCIGTDLAVICLDSIDDKKEKRNVVKHLTENGKEIITISEDQVVHFAGNMLEVNGNNNKPYLVMSQDAKDSLELGQLNQLEKYVTLLSHSLKIIEAYGGGSARCMMAEIFLPKKDLQT